ncbi:helix-turn-helix domain-containing protein [Geodermatophilus marinus]|uniref:helix-turn-helix domain-containing protein n=1 Tax=Geodermatophilus sp. LHW52908 TaxID=2303986 RepID=UPI000E3E2A5B|nr:helix-turn-helix domain-containing protein [Geodermatophilus sp. LHW52908]RFU18820.1 helix-turn-helix domain-containing protein [Geodermatophilus sp. LHW52908]
MTATLGAPARECALPPSVRDVGEQGGRPGRHTRGRCRPATLTAARLTAGLTMTQLARAVHVSRPNVSLWENGGRRPARQYWPALGAALGLQFHEVEALFADHPPARLDGEPLPSLGLVRRQRGFTQRTLAGLVEVAPTTLAMWETAGVRVSPGVAEELARVLDVEVARLAARPRAVPAVDPRPLRRLRRQAGMTQREAAAHLRIALGTLARYEAGARVPPVAVARRMATAYRRPPEQLLAACGIELPDLPDGAPWRAADLPEAIRVARMAAGMTKVELGRVLGRSGQAVRSWEVGRSRPSEVTCRRLEAVCGLPAGSLSA